MTDPVALMIARDEGTLTPAQEDELAQFILETEFFKSVGWAGRFLSDKLESGWRPVLKRCSTCKQSWAWQNNRKCRLRNQSVRVDDTCMEWEAE
jgi:hypothetical protein